MHNYLKTLDTSKPLLVKLTFRPIIDNGAPHANITCNQILVFNNILGNPVTANVKVGIMDDIELTITLSGKEYSSIAETAIIIEQFTIDDHDIIPYLDQAVYTNDGDYTGPSNYYLGFNGTWKFKISEPFYHWWHRASGQGWLLSP